MKSHITRRISGLMVLAASLGLGHLTTGSVVYAQAGSISTISPSCASVGDRVGITGTGLGARNVSIAVGGVPAQVVFANGNSATFVVPAAAPLGNTTVTATNPGGHTGSIAFRVCDLLLPETWSGRWQVDVAYLDPATNRVVKEDVFTTSLHTDEPFGLMPIADRFACSGTVTSGGLQTQCAGRFTVGLCTATASLQLGATLDATTGAMTGGGTSATTLSGACGPLATNSPSFASNIRLTGQRLGPDDTPPAPLNSLFRNFVPFAALIVGQ